MFGRLARFALPLQALIGKFDQKFRIGERTRRAAANPGVRRHLPAADWLSNYDRDELPGDVTGGIVVAIMLVPQSMAYALLAGLPAQVGLYASVLPLLLYAMFGTSRTLAVGPVAIVSLMVATALAPIAEPGSAQYAAYAVALACISGLFLLCLGILRLGVVVNFISHPVIAGFTSAAALVIGFSQLKHLLGLDIERTYFIPEIIRGVFSKADSIDLITVVISLCSITLLASRNRIGALFQNRGFPPIVALQLPKAMPLFVVLIGTVLVWVFNLSDADGVRIVGAIPSGLPPVSLPEFNWEVWQQLLSAAALISMIGFLESVSVAKSLASKRRQKIDPNQEFIGLGMANIAAALSAAYPVTGGFSRSVVNFTSGSNTQLSSIITAAFVAVALLVLTPALHYLPKAILASIIVVAITSLVDIKAFWHAWRYNPADGLGYLATFLGVLFLGVEKGIAIGIVGSLALHLWRTSKPHIAIVGRVGTTEHFRNVRRHPVRTYENLLLVRIDESLYFANTSYLENQLLKLVAEQPKIEHLVLICAAMNAVDASALETLEQLITRLRDSGVVLHLAEVKGPVMDDLRRTKFKTDLTPGRIFLSTHEAVCALEKNTSQTNVARNRRAHPPTNAAPGMPGPRPEDK